jgi:quercetin dioxygenase-like cupin family protein
MLQQQTQKFNNLRANILDFPETGDTLPMHNHDETSVHITIVARGSFHLHGDGWEMIAKAGDIIDWEPGKRHEFVALEPNSRCVNIPKNMLSSAPIEDCP